jgi:hypothetical protein
VVTSKQGLQFLRVYNELKSFYNGAPVVSKLVSNEQYQKAFKQNTTNKQLRAMRT